MRSAHSSSVRRWTLASAAVAVSSFGCSALFTADLADNGGAGPNAGAAGVAGRAGASGGAGAAGLAGGNTGGSSGARAGSGGSAGSLGQAGSAGVAGKGGASAGSAGAGGAAGQGGTSPVAGSGGAATGGSGQAAGQAGSATAGGTGGTAPSGGTGGASASAGSGGAGAGTGGAGAGGGGTAGAGTGGASGGSAGVGAAAGASGAAGTGGASGVGGTNGCPQLPPGQPPPLPECGNGVVEAGEECDVGGGLANDGCNEVCQLTCVNGVRVGRSCYAVSSNTFRGEQVFITPATAGFPDGNAFLADFGTSQSCGHLLGPTSHIAVLNRTGEREALLASTEFKAHLSNGVSGTKNGSAWVAVGYLWVLGGQIDDRTRWFWSEGGAVDPGQWAAGYPQNDGSGPGGAQADGCGSINPALSYENHDCETLRRPVLCEREPPCAMRASAGSPWQVGYQGENGHCYLRLAQQTSYENATTACQSLGAHLAAFETIAEARALPGVTSGLSSLWVGAERDTCGGGGVPGNEPFVWATNGAVVPTGTDSGYWSPGEPDESQNNRRCAQMTRSHGLDAEACGSAFRALCERDY